MNMKLRLFYLLPLLFSSLLAFGQVSGTVFLDLPMNGTTLNSYGVKNANEIGVEGVTVTIYPGGATTTTASDGTWSLAVANGTEVRVEFSGWPSYLRESADGGGGNTSVQTVVAPSSTVDFGLFDPNDYCNTSNPSMIIPTWTTGSMTGSTRAGLYAFKYNNSQQNVGDPDFDGTYPGPTPDTCASLDEVGGTWGLAYQNTEERFFAATFLRRNVEIADGLGYIYVIDRSSTPGTLVHSFDLSGVVTASGGTIDLGSVCRGGGCENDPGNTGIEEDYLVPASYNTPDLDAAKKVGKVSFGDMDMRAGTDELWVVNLYQKALIKIDVSDPVATNLPGAVDQFIITSLPGIPNCPNGELRPWGLRFENGKGYLGVVCDASAGGQASDLEGFVLSFDPDNVAAGFSTEISFPLDFDRGDALYEFAPWSSTWSDFRENPGTGWWALPQPIVSDIAFDKNGNMNIAIMDRSALLLFTDALTIESGSNTFVWTNVLGDIYHACKTGSGYEMEGSGTCPVNFGDKGFQGTGEFYNDIAGDGNLESAEGSVQILKGSNELAMTVLDPNPIGGWQEQYASSHGVTFYSSVDGSIQDYYGIEKTKSSMEVGKGAGMGDIELLLPPAPIEIGNLVWDDANSNGIQDPAESGLANVTVELVQGATVIATATTDVNGRYVFSNDTSSTTTASHIYAVSAIEPGMNYIVRVPSAIGSGAQAVLFGKAISTANSGEGINADLNDNDGVLNGNNVTISVAGTDIPVLGANNHSFDFGFSPAPDIVVNSATPSACAPTTNTYSLTVSVTYANAPLGDITISTSNGVSQIFTPVSQNGTETFVLSNLISDGVVDIDVTATYVNDNTVTSTRIDAYTAPVSCTTCPAARCLPLSVNKH